MPAIVSGGGPCPDTKQIFLIQNLRLAHWNFDGGFTDTSGNASNHNGLELTPVLRSNGDNSCNGSNTVQGLIGTGQAACFRGGGDYVLASSTANTEFNFGTTRDFAVSMRINLSQFANSNGHQILLNNATVDSLQIGINYNNGDVRKPLQFYGGGQAPITSDPLDWSLNESKWYDITISRKGASIKIYRDGIEVASGMNTGSIGDNSSLYIGARPDGSYPFWGLMDEVTIYNKFFSPDDVTNFQCATEILAGNPLPATCQ